eukprot:TRINITY_DN38786_c0_g1_i1.p1 TRINITY_DN38786_c0_g1~~TRINITY_DN38786_c0_g1_i1.p1  ORF type:complete len:695 (-),score=202.35 TRINITY_DN38786_c0_g1_i1:743-2827(-)
MNFLRSVLFEEVPDTDPEEEDEEEDEGEAGEGEAEVTEVQADEGVVKEAMPPAEPAPANLTPAERTSAEASLAEPTSAEPASEPLLPEAPPPPPTASDPEEAIAAPAPPPDLPQREAESTAAPVSPVAAPVTATSPAPRSPSQILRNTFSSWGIGDLVKNSLKTIQAKSEELYNEYREELEEFSEGLRKETEDLVERTGHRVKDLPSSLETGAHVAQESLEEVGQTIEEFGSSFWRGTKEIFVQVREAVALVEEEAALSANKAKRQDSAYSASMQRGKYSRYEALVSAMQRDSGTYCDEPEEGEDYAAWKAQFNLEEKKPDIDAILKNNAFMQELQSRIVPLIVEHDTFWMRYFYRLHRLQQAEDARADLVKRAANVEDEELTWDVDEDAESPLLKTEGGQAAAEAEGQKGENLSGMASDVAPADGSIGVLEGTMASEGESASQEKALPGGVSSLASDDAAEEKAERHKQTGSELATKGVTGVRVDGDRGMVDQAGERSPESAASQEAATGSEDGNGGAGTLSDVSSVSGEWQVVNKEDNNGSGHSASEEEAAAPPMAVVPEGPPPPPAAPAAAPPAATAAPAASAATSAASPAVTKSKVASKAATAATPERKGASKDATKSKVAAPSKAPAIVQAPGQKGGTPKAKELSTTPAPAPAAAVSAPAVAREKAAPKEEETGGKGEEDGEGDWGEWE